MADHTPCHYDALGKRLAIGQRVYFTSHDGSPYTLSDQKPGIVVKLWPRA